MGNCVFPSCSKEFRFDLHCHSMGAGICWRLAQGARSCFQTNDSWAQIGNELEKIWGFGADGEIPQNSEFLLYRFLSKPPQKSLEFPTVPRVRKSPPPS